MKSARTPRNLEKKKQVREVTLIIDSKILDEEIARPLEQTLRHPLSALTINMNAKPKEALAKTPTNIDFNSTLKRTKHSKSKSQDKRTHSMQRSKSLSNMASTPHLKSLSFVSKQSNIKCFQKLIFKITDFFEKQGVYWQFKKLSYLNILTLLYELHYVPNSSEKQLMENSLAEVLKTIYQFWLNITNKTFATLENFIYLICCIENIPIQFDHIESAINSFTFHLGKRDVKFIQPEQYTPEYRFVGVPAFTRWNLKGNLEIDKHCSWKIQQTFSSFKTTRLHHYQRNIKEIQVEKVSLSNKTNKLALNKRQKIEAIIRNRKPDIEKITLQDILNFKEDTLIHVPMSARTYDQSKDSVFKQLRKRPRLKIHRKCGPLMEMLSQPKQIKIHSKEELQFQRNKRQCTFRPDISPLKVNQSQDLLQIKNVVKTLQRMKFIRQSKIEQQELRQTGWTNNNHNRRSKSKDHQESANYRLLSDRQEYSNSKDSRQQAFQKDRDRDFFEKTQLFPKCQHKLQLKPSDKQPKTDVRIPLLFIDINIDENQKQRLVIYEEDNSSELATNFSKKHNLSQEMEQKLKELLDYQMNSILTKIEEEAEEEEMF